MALPCLFLSTWTRQIVDGVSERSQAPKALRAKLDDNPVGK